MSSSTASSEFGLSKKKANAAYYEKNKIDHIRATKLVYWNKQFGKENVTCFVKLMGFDAAVEMMKAGQLEKRAELRKKKAESKRETQAAKPARSPRVWHEFHDKSDYSETTELAQLLFKTMNAARTKS